MKPPTFETFNQEWADKVVGRVSRTGIDSYLGLEVTAVEPGRLVCKMPVTDQLITGMGLIVLQRRVGHHQREHPDRCNPPRQHR